METGVSCSTLRDIVVASVVALTACAPSAKPAVDRADETAGAPRELAILALADTQWTAGPESAVRVAHVYRDPSSAGLFIQRMIMPAGAKTPPHWHTHDELITVLSGSIYIGSGDVLDENAKEIGPGGLVIIPARSHHFGGSKNGAVLQVQGIGPFEMNWLR